MYFSLTGDKLLSHVQKTLLTVKKFLRVGGLLPAASVSKNGLMTSGIYKLSALHFVTQNKKMKLFKLTSYAEAIFEIIGRSSYEEFVHLIVTHANKNITIKKGIYNTSPDERISYKFYKDDTYLYVINNLDSFTVRTLGTTDINMLAFETNDDSSTSGLTSVSITG